MFECRHVCFGGTFVHVACDVLARLCFAANGAFSNRGFATIWSAADPLVFGFLNVQLVRFDAWRSFGRLRRVPLLAPLLMPIALYLRDVQNLFAIWASTIIKANMREDIGFIEVRRFVWRAFTALRGRFEKNTAKVSIE